MSFFVFLWSAALCAAPQIPFPLEAQSNNPAGQSEWAKTLDAARKGQEIVSKALGQASRRLDVDTKWLRETGVIPAKDQVSVKEFLQVENQSEEKLDRIREPAQKFARSLLK